MKIGLVCPYNIALGGGVQEIVFALQEHLTERGHTAKIITAQPRQKNKVDASKVIFLGTSIDLRWPNQTTAPFSSTIDTEAIEQVIDAERFDILHFHEPWVPALSRQILARSQSVNVATFHAKVPETIVSRTLALVITPYMQTVLNDLHELTAASEPAAEYVRSLTDRPVSIIPNGIDINHFQRAPQVGSEGAKTILYIGRLEGRKGLKYLLIAYHQLAQELPGLRLVIAGNGPERRRLEVMAQELELPNVEFLGYVSDEQKVQLLASSDLFCSPAVYGESFGIVLLEAMASGLVTVAGDNSGYASVMQGLGALSLVNPRDIPEFARRMKLLLTEPKLRALWQSWARQQIKQYSYKSVVDQYEALYKRSLRKHRAALRQAGRSA